MLNLYWKSGGQTRSLVERPFKSEAELEKYIFDNQELLGGDISIIYRQIRTGSKQGIPDMLGVDQDDRICLIAWKLRFKITEDEAKAFNGQHWEFQSYDSTFKEATFRPLHPGSPDVKELEPLFVQAYKRVAGVK